MCALAQTHMHIYGAPAKYLSDPRRRVYFARRRGIQARRGGGGYRRGPRPVQTSLAEVSHFHLIVVRQTAECNQLTWTVACPGKYGLYLFRGKDKSFRAVLAAWFTIRWRKVTRRQQSCETCQINGAFSITQFLRTRATLPHTQFKVSNGMYRLCTTATFYIVAGPDLWCKCVTQHSFYLPTWNLKSHSLHSPDFFFFLMGHSFFLHAISILSVCQPLQACMNS